MRRLLKGRTWRIRGNNAAEASMVVAVAALLVPVLIFVGAGVITYREIEQQAEERISRTLELLYNNVRTTFESEYLVAANVTELLDDYATNADIRANERKLHDRLEHLVGRLPQVEDVWVLDEEGRPVVSAKVFPLPAGFGYADRAYFAALRGGEPRTISELLHGRVKNTDFFQYSERRQKPDGSFNGAIAVSISPSYFTKQFARASDAAHFTAALIRADGEILARYPGAGSGSKLGPETGFIRTTKAQPLEGGYTLGSGVIPTLLKTDACPFAVAD